MEKLNYDFSEIEILMAKLKSKGSSSSILNDLRDEVNRFFKDSKCKEIIYTNNNDKLFFGMYTIPVLDGEQAVKMLYDDKPVRFKEYYLEFDSKLFSPLLDLTPRELTAILLHEIGHVVNSAEPVEKIRHAVDAYLIENDETLVITDSVHYKELIAFAIKNSVRKVSSIFEKNDEELIADEFVVRCGYGPDLEEAFRRIVRFNGKLNRDVSNKLLVLQWTLRLYKNVKYERIKALRTLNRGKQLTASKLEAREMENVIRRLNKIDDDVLVETTQIVKEALVKNDFLKDFRVKGMRSIEDELYEFSMRARNIDEEDESLLLIRQLNSRISIIDEFIATSELSEKERERWYNVLDKYKKLRYEFANKVTYQNKQYGLFVQYPEIKPNQNSFRL